MKYLLDTNVISELVAKRPNERVVQWLDAREPDSLYLSVITIGGLSKGIEKLPETARKNDLRDWIAEALLSRFQGRVLLLDAAAMLTWGDLMARLERQGRQMAAMDSLIAALVLTHACALVTRNVSDFAHTGVVVVNPWDESAP